MDKREVQTVVKMKHHKGGLILTDVDRSDKKIVNSLKTELSAGQVIITTADSNHVETYKFLTGKEVDALIDNLKQLRKFIM